jgi:hypothetical protein
VRRFEHALAALPHVGRRPFERIPVRRVGGSVNLDYRPAEGTLVRIEGRLLGTSDPVFLPRMDSKATMRCSRRPSP